MTSIGSPSPFFLAGKKAYAVDRSLRFNNDADTASLTRTPSGAGNRKTWTFSVWVKRSVLSGDRAIFNAGGAGSPNTTIRFETSTDQLNVFEYSGSYVYRLNTNRQFRDLSAWYHIVVAFDTTQSTANDRIKIYVNGVEETSFSVRTNPSQNTDYSLNNSVAHTIGNNGASNYYSGYLAEINHIDGSALTPSSFGETDTITGQWIPKQYTGSYGTNGFYLNFSTNTLGTDRSGNSNDFTPNNFSVVAGAGNDALEDTPTNNFCTINPLAAGRLDIFPDTSNGNLDFNISSSFKNPASSFQIPTSGKWYAEYVFTTVGSGVVNVGNLNKSQGSSAAEKLNGISLLGGEIRVNDSSTQTSLSAFGANDIIGVKVDRDAGTVAFTVNGSAVGNAENISSMNAPTDLIFRAYRNSSGGSAPVGSVNFGQRPFSYLPTGYKSLCSANLTDPTILLPNKHFATFTYTGTGSSGDVVNITNSDVDFTPDFVWVKTRDVTNDHILSDAVRGGNKYLVSSENYAEQTDTDKIRAFIQNGFESGTDGDTNWSGSRPFVAWNWNAGDTDGKTYTVKVVSDSGNKYRFDDFGTSAVTLDLAEGGTYVFDWSDSSAQSHPIRFSTTSDGTHGGGTEYTTGVVKDDSAYKTTITVAASAPTLYYYCQYHSGMGGQVNTNSTLGSSNFDGSLQATVKANTTAGFSIGTYTAQSSGSATVGHGLGIAPDVVITKSRTVTSNWYIYHKDIGQDGWILFTSGAATTSNSAVWNPAPTSSVFTYGSGLVNQGNIVFYAFSEVAGYSKFGSYTGNGSTDGTFVFTGFRPAFILWKSSTQTATNWVMVDNKRDTFNVVDAYLLADVGNNVSGAEGDLDLVDFLSNGFKLRQVSGNNESGQTIIYLAFAESPFKYARAR